MREEKCPGGICPGEYADMKLNMCVVWTKMQVDFKDGRGTNTQQVTDGFLSYLLLLLLCKSYVIRFVKS